MEEVLEPTKMKEAKQVIEQAHNYLTWKESEILEFVDTLEEKYAKRALEKWGVQEAEWIIIKKCDSVWIEFKKVGLIYQFESKYYELHIEPKLEKDTIEDEVFSWLQYQSNYRYRDNYRKGWQHRVRNQMARTSGRIRGYV